MVLQRHWSELAHKLPGPYAACKALDARQGRRHANELAALRGHQLAAWAALCLLPSLFCQGLLLGLL